MIILHDGLGREVREVSNIISKVYNISSIAVRTDLNKIFDKVEKFDGFMLKDYYEVLNQIPLLKDSAILILTNKDLYADTKSQDDDWVFGSNIGNLSIASTARMKRNDELPSQEILVPFDLYLKRVNVLSLHEIGHDIIKGKHFKPAKWVSSKGYELDLGLHCTDNKCVMYEVVDIKTPTKEEGFMLLGDEKKFDAGLDDVVGRIYDNWLCDKCKNSINIDSRFDLI